MRLRANTLMDVEPAALGPVLILLLLLLLP